MTTPAETIRKGVIARFGPAFTQDLRWLAGRAEAGTAGAGSPSR